MPKNPAQAHLDQKLLGRIPLVVGVTGHRDLRPGGDRAALAAEVDAVFTELKAKYLEGQPETPIVVLSSLAEGADQLVSDVAISHGAVLIAPLPMELDEYVADFRAPRCIEPDAETKFRAMLDRALAHVEPPYREAGSRPLVASDENKRAEQYQDAGIFIVRNCHVLIALSNGEDTGLTGGTAEIIKFKREGIPLKLSASINAALDGSEVGPVIEIVTPRAKVGSPEVKIGIKPWGSAAPWFIWTAIKRLAVFGASACGFVPHAHPNAEDRSWLVFRALAEQTRRFNREAKTASRRHRRAPTPAKSLSQLFENTKQEVKVGAEPSAVRSAPYWCELYKLADVAAILRQKQFKIDWFLLFAVGFVALIAFELFAHIWPELHLLLAAYVGMFAVIFGWFIIARHREHQERFLDYRALAEALRVAVYWKLGGIEASVSDAYPIKQPSELAWVKITLRAIDMLHLTDSPEPIPMDARSLELIRELWIDGQRGYFQRQGDRHHRRAERGEAQSILFLALSPLVGLGLLWWAPALGLLHHSLIVAMGLFAGGGAVVAGYIEKLAHNAHARQYDRMRLLFEQALWLMPAGAVGADLDRTEELYRALGSEAMKENADWVAIYRQRPIRPAG